MNSDDDDKSMDDEEGANPNFPTNAFDAMRHKKKTSGYQDVLKRMITRLETTGTLGNHIDKEEIKDRKNNDQTDMEEDDFLDNFIDDEVINHDSMSQFVNPHQGEPEDEM